MRPRRSCFTPNSPSLATLPCQLTTRCFTPLAPRTFPPFLPVRCLDVLPPALLVRHRGPGHAGLALPRAVAAARHGGCDAHVTNPQPVACEPPRPVWLPAYLDSHVHPAAAAAAVSTRRALLPRLPPEVPSGRGCPRGAPRVRRRPRVDHHRHVPPPRRRPPQRPGRPRALRVPVLCASFLRAATERCPSLVLRVSRIPATGCVADIVSVDRPGGILSSGL